MNAKWKKLLLLLLAAVFFFGVSRVQNSLNRDRDKLGLTRVQPLENAPPVLAFTTVALGGFRGLISNALWIRASDLQDEDKFFEMAQLADWITKLEPHFVQVWLVQAWNMAYNISVKFKDYPDRWRWVQRGVELLRDDGLHFNPNETLIYRELAWFFQHKIGQNLDDANMYYKQEWAAEIAKPLPKGKPDPALVNPQTDEDKARARLLREKFKMDPQFIIEVDKRYGPLEWRLPEAHAIYWATLGLKKAEENPTKIKKDDLMTLRRVIYQSLQMSFRRGRLVNTGIAKTFEFGPNLEIIPKVSDAYEQQAREEPEMRDHILSAHRNFLRDAVYFLYGYNRLADAAYWYKYLGTHYPDKTLLDRETNSFPAKLTLDQYAVARLKEDLGEALSQERVKAALEGLLVNSFMNLAVDEDERAEGYLLLARQLLASYEENTKVRQESLRLPTLEEIRNDVLNRLLDPEQGVPFELRAILRTKLRLPAETKPPSAPGATNTIPPKVSSK